MCCLVQHMTHEEEESFGRAAALQQLRAACELQLALGASQIAVDSIELQSMQARF